MTPAYARRIVEMEVIAMPGLGHCGAQRGKRVRIVYKDGSSIDGNFYEQNDRLVFLDVDGGKRVSIHKREIRSFYPIRKG